MPCGWGCGAKLSTTPPILESEGTGQAEMGSSNNASIAAYAIDGAIPQVGDLPSTWTAGMLQADVSGVSQD